MTDSSEKAPKILDQPIGLDATGMRTEFDSLGHVEVPANRYWGAQTQRSLQHFNIGNDRMPKEVYHAYGYVTKAAAMVNTRELRRHAITVVEVNRPDRAARRRHGKTDTVDALAAAHAVLSGRANGTSGRGPLGHRRHPAYAGRTAGQISGSARASAQRATSASEQSHRRCCSATHSAR
jgi:hypothetical protein